MKKNEAEFAFARPHSESEEFFFDAQAGMTLRDYFAAKAMQAVLTNHKLEECDDDVVAKNCYQMADFMMKAREA
jgi:hypothetical protein